MGAEEQQRQESDWHRIAPVMSRFNKETESKTGKSGLAISEAATLCFPGRCEFLHY